MPRRWEPDALDGRPMWIRLVVSIVVTGLVALVLEHVGTRVWAAYYYPSPATFWVVVAVFAFLLGPTLVATRRWAMWVPMLLVGAIMTIGELWNHYGNISWTFEGGWLPHVSGERLWDWHGGQLFGVRQPFAIALIAGAIESLVVPASILLQKPIIALLGTLVPNAGTTPVGPTLAAKEALFASSTSPRASYKPPHRDLGFWLLRVLGLVFGVYLSYLLLGLAVGGRDLPLVDMYFLNPAATVHTFGKLVVLGALARIAAYDRDVRKDLTLLLLVGHALAVAISLWLWLGTASPLFPAHHEFLLTSAIIDGILLVAILVVHLREGARSSGKEGEKDPELQSPATAATRLFFLVAGAVYAGIFVVAVMSRAFVPKGGALYTLFAGPDPAAINIGTKFATLAALCFLARARPRVRPHLEGVLALVLIATAIGALAHAVGVGWFVGPDGASRTLPGYLVIELLGAAVGLALLLGLRRARYHVDLNVTSMTPASAECVMALHDALREGDRGALQHRREALQRVDAYIAGIRGKRRGFIGFPFFLLEHLFARLAFRPRFSLLSRDEARWLLRRHLLRPPWERAKAAIPPLAELMFKIADTLNALLGLAYYSSPPGRAEVGYVPPEARKRLQALVADESPSDGAAAPLPKHLADAPGVLGFPTLPLARALMTPRLGANPMRAAPPIEEAYDYVVIGSGAGGAVVAHRLAQAGKRVIIVEAGAHFAPIGDFNGDELRMYRTLYADGGLQTTRSFDFTVLQGRCLGGSTVINNAVCFELPPPARKLWQERYGLAGAELDRHYADVAREIQIQEVRAEAINANTERFFTTGVAQHNTSGWNPLDEAKRVSGNFGACLGCGLCNVGCMFVRKLSTLETYIPWAEAHGARVLTGAEAVSCATARNGATDVRAVAVTVRRGDGELVTIKADKGIVVAAGALASSRFLMRSGIGGAHVGKNLSCNFAFPMLALFEEDLAAFDGLQITHFARQPDNRAIYETSYYTPGAYAMLMPQYFERHQAMMAGYRQGLYLGTLVGSGPNGRVLPKPTAMFGRPFEWAQEAEDFTSIKQALKTLASIGHHAGATDLYLPTLPALHVKREDYPAAMKRFDDTALGPDILNWATAHPQGGNRMAATERDADGRSTDRVVDGSFRVVGTSNVFVADASLFPESATVNPQWTIMALASLASDSILSAG